MADDLLTTLKTQIPALFARTVAELERRAAAERGASLLLAGLEKPAFALLRITGAGAGELWLQLSRAGAVPCAPPAAGAFGHALALPANAARHALEWLLREGVEQEPLLRAFAGMCSAEARDLFESARYAFELQITRVPLLGELRVLLALGEPSLPAATEFKLSVDWDELEDAREQGIGPESLFMAGKVQIDGDVAKAMMLGMTLAQLR
jgi:hypothetical protein